MPAARGIPIWKLLRDRKDGLYPTAGMMDASSMALILRFLVLA
jgi:hypothetical protein